MKQPNKFLIDGIDRLGKSTLINNILDHLGYHLVVHYDKPKLLDRYECGDKNLALKQYQYDCNTNMFHLVDFERSEARIIFDRTHLGELVYAPLYRKYSGDYVYQLESQVDTSDSRLILLITSDFSICVDDGESFNFDNKVIEQQKFLQAFTDSSIEDKVIIDVHNGKGGFKSPQNILEEALRKSTK